MSVISKSYLQDVLPVELIISIHDSSTVPIGNIMARTCKGLHNIITPVLYRQLSLTDHNGHLCLQCLYDTVHRSPQMRSAEYRYAEMVEILSIRSRWWMHKTGILPMLHKVLPGLNNLRCLDLQFALDPMVRTPTVRRGYLAAFREMHLYSAIAGEMPYGGLVAPKLDSVIVSHLAMAMDLVPRRDLSTLKILEPLNVQGLEMFLDETYDTETSRSLEHLSLTVVSSLVLKDMAISLTFIFNQLRELRVTIVGGQWCRSEANSRSPEALLMHLAACKETLHILEILVIDPPGDTVGDISGRVDTERFFRIISLLSRLGEARPQFHILASLLSGEGNGPDKDLYSRTYALTWSSFTQYSRHARDMDTRLRAKPTLSFAYTLKPRDCTSIGPVHIGTVASNCLLANEMVHFVTLSVAFILIALSMVITTLVAGLGDRRICYLSDGWHQSRMKDNFSTEVTFVRVIAKLRVIYTPVAANGFYVEGGDLLGLNGRYISMQKAALEQMLVPEHRRHTMLTSPGQAYQRSRTYSSLAGVFGGSRLENIATSGINQRTHSSTLFSGTPQFLRDEPAADPEEGFFGMAYNDSVKASTVMGEISPVISQDHSVRGTVGAVVANHVLSEDEDQAMPYVETLDCDRALWSAGRFIESIATLSYDETRDIEGIELLAAIDQYRGPPGSVANVMIDDVNEISDNTPPCEHDDSSAYESLVSPDEDSSSDSDNATSSGAEEASFVYNKGDIIAGESRKYMRITSRQAKPAY
ncbi:hypothetical protein K474DRAFT_1680489 [Panus rudis PR-1116 ss-1]|nr:hypothetical protein K474DRAFT_1680489 [Panus rudis PR-1116 ss-1]